MTQFNENMPVYLQIIQNIKADIVAGRLKGGDKMPSVREMSETLMVNPNTMQRVLTELEREGILYSQRGKGSFVSEKPDLVAGLRTTQAQKYTARYVEEMKQLGMSENEMMAYIQRMTEGKSDDSSGV